MRRFYIRFSWLMKHHQHIVLSVVFIAALCMRLNVVSKRLSHNTIWNSERTFIRRILLAIWHPRMRCQRVPIMCSCYRFDHWNKDESNQVHSIATREAYTQHCSHLWIKQNQNKRLNTNTSGQNASVTLIVSAPMLFISLCIHLELIINKSFAADKQLCKDPI